MKPFGLSSKEYVDKLRLIVNTTNVAKPEKKKAINQAIMLNL